MAASIFLARLFCLLFLLLLGEKVDFGFFAKCALAWRMADGTQRVRYAGQRGPKIKVGNSSSNPDFEAVFANKLVLVYIDNYFGIF